MNRKMRAKANNAAAKAKRDRKSCSKEDQLLPATPQGTCDECGGELIPVYVVTPEPDGPRTLH